MAASAAHAQARQFTAADYTAAERWTPYEAPLLVTGTVSGIEYLADGRVFYRKNAPGETLYFVADPHSRATALAFDSRAMAAELRRLTQRALEPGNMRISGYKPDGNGYAIDTAVGRFHCDGATHCTAVAEPQPVQADEPKPSAQNATGSPATATLNQPVKRVAAPPAAPSRRRGAAAGEVSLNRSPDGSHAVFVRDWNLWVRDLSTGAEHALTTDGVTDFGYATDNAGWQHSDAAIVTWSPDGRKLATFQLDQRGVGMMYVVPVTNRHPQLEAWHYPLLGDKIVATIQPVVIDVASGSAVRLKSPPLEHRSMECDDVSCNGNSEWTDAIFSKDGTQLAYVATSRDHKDEWVRVADTASGSVREVYHEHVPTYYGWQSKTDWQFLPASGEFLWVSERSDTAQIYLYDLATGKLKTQLTHGTGPVSDIVGVDEAARTVYFTAVGRESTDDNPYMEHLYSVGFDGGTQRLLTPEPGTHTITAAPDASSFVDVYSTVSQPRTAVLRGRDGGVLVQLGTQDVTALKAAGWEAPMLVQVKARDGKTPLYGMLWKPANFDASKKYPVIDEVYPGPQGSLCQLMGRNFSASKSDMQSLASLGFAVVCIDGMGNPGRTKSFHDAHASKPEEMGDDTIPDQVSGIKDLAAQYPWLDATRVGITGHSGGGNATASAMLHFPEFFSVGWAESGNHDNREYEDDWDERWSGLEVVSADGKHDNYEAQANQNYVANLRGQLMLVHGSSDDNVPMDNTLLLAQALMRANKRFDMLIVPGARHGYGGMTSYIEGRKFDYFITHLMGATPPAAWAPLTPEEQSKAYVY